MKRKRSVSCEDGRVIRKLVIRVTIFRNLQLLCETCNREKSNKIE
ncbi:MAG: HNH endonuclease [Odoribacteraceae bacterium]|nr:HNH endonuclease [Odoribacteraceae bacterium]